MVLILFKLFRADAQRACPSVASGPRWLPLAAASVPAFPKSEFLTGWVTCGFEFHLFPTPPFSPYFKPRLRGTDIQPPGELGAECIQEILAFQLHQLYPVLCAMHVESREMVQHLAARIEVDEVLLAPGIHLER